jgi:RNA polymerase subunit RPABC4/transcription elongation factor Spt4
MFQIEKMRVMVQVKLAHLAKNRHTCSFSEELLVRTTELEKWIDSTVAEAVKLHPTYNWWSHISGCGLENMPKLIGQIERFGTWYVPGDMLIPPHARSRRPEKVYNKTDDIWEDKVRVEAIERFTMPSKLRKYVGLYPGATTVHGKMSKFSKQARVAAYRLGTSFIRGGTNKYYQFYCIYKEALRKRKEDAGIKIIPTPNGRYCTECEQDMKVPKDTRYCPECGTELMKKTEPEGYLYLGHLNNMAIRRMMELFLDHLWVIWREELGLPVTAPYPMAILGHSDYIDPHDMMNK